MFSNVSSFQKTVRFRSVVKCTCIRDRKKTEHTTQRQNNVVNNCHRNFTGRQTRTSFAAYIFIPFYYYCDIRFVCVLIGCMGKSHFSCKCSCTLRPNLIMPQTRKLNLLVGFKLECLGCNRVFQNIAKHTSFLFVC